MPQLIYWPSFGRLVVADESRAAVANVALVASFFACLLRTSFW